MNQTKDEARARVYSANDGSLADNPSLDYLRELQWYLGVWKKQVDLFLEETIKAQPTTVPMRRAVRIIHEDGFTSYFNGFGWSTKPTWNTDILVVNKWLKSARALAAPSLSSLIKIVHPKCKCTTPHPDWDRRYHTINCPLSKSR
jgi:hypothetical protein